MHNGTSVIQPPLIAAIESWPEGDHNIVVPLYTTVDNLVILLRGVDNMYLRQTCLILGLKADWVSNLFSVITIFPPRTEI